jgi:DNA-binding beta-propeller fold protein YncE
VWLTSMGDGKLYPLDTTAGTIGEGVGGAPDTTSICGVAWNADATKAYVVNMFNPEDPTIPGYVAILDWPSGEMIGKIDNVTAPSPDGAPLAHQAESTPDKKFLYVTDGVDGKVIKIDMETDEIVKEIDTGYEPHSIVFTADGKTAYIAVRSYPDEGVSGVFVMDVETDEITKRISGITQPLICGLIIEEEGA